LKHKYELGFIGCGNMGSAILRGIISKNVISPGRLAVSDIDTTKIKNLSVGWKGYDTNYIVRNSNRILLAVKPQVIRDVLKDVATVIPIKTLLISIAAGISIKKLTEFLEGHKRIIRVMPSTPALVGFGAAAITSLRNNVPDKDMSFTKRIFESVGIVAFVAEKHIDAVTALSGSGPAYFFYLTEHLITAGHKMGLPCELVQRFSLQTALGSAELAVKSNQPPQILRKNVTSPGGTTEAAIKLLDDNKWGDLFIKAVLRAESRARELGG